MSQNETYFGKIRKIEVKDLELWCKRTCEVFYGLTSDDLDKNETWQDKFHWKNDNKQWMILDNEVYAIEQLVNFDEDTGIYMEKQPDDSIVFGTTFYNGGTWLGEMLEEEIKRLKL